MCGLAGFFDPRQGDAEPALRALAGAMADQLAYRGPDAFGSWADAQAGVAFGHRRLSIIDLSIEGAQPMRDRSGRYVIAYNGELYNFAALRAELGDVPWRGHCDTEVLLEAVLRFGLEGALERMVGMFAFALWDREARRLHLVRDRLGEKPLYYGRAQGDRGPLLFASELKAFAAHPQWRAQVDRDALAAYFRFGWIPGPKSIYRGVYKLPAGTVLTIDAAHLDDLPEPRAYWSLEQAMRKGSEQPFSGTETEACDQLAGRLGEAVGGQMMSDVPLGAFLSGGIDSSLVVALMQQRAGGRVRSFSIGFEDARFDESPYARAVAAHLGTEHTELIVTPAQLLDSVPQVATLYDEPFADSSQIPTLLVARLARATVTVSLSGDGADETFGGYDRHRHGFLLRSGAASKRMRQAAAQFTGPAQKLLSGAAALTGAPTNLAQARLGKIRQLLAAGSFAERYAALVSLAVPQGEIVPGAADPLRALSRAHAFEARPARSALMLADSAYYLPDDVLVKVDRATMAVSLESRAPFLDHRVVEFAWSLPERFKLRAGRGKWILRELLARHVPRALFERPKMGFSLPIASWLRGPLRDWAQSLLDERALAQGGLIDPAPLRYAWNEHLAGRGNWQHLLWAALVFERWQAAQKNATAAVAVP